MLEEDDDNDIGVDTTCAESADDEQPLKKLNKKSSL